MAFGEPDSTARLSIKGARQYLLATLDLQTGRLMLWAPVFLIAGIWTYFSLSQEPSQVAVVILAFAASLLIFLSRKYSVCLLLALIFLGFTLAKFREYRIATPLLRATVSESEISGYVADADNRGGKRRILVIELDSATNIPENEVPQRVRITTFHAPEVLIGDYLTMTARLNPLPMPIAPNAFDYGRDLYFQSIGAVGTSKTAPTIEKKSVPHRFAVRRFFHGLRSAMGERITTTIKGPLGAFANAIITGERAAIPKEMNTSLQISGLAHILSISGLHMSLVAGGVFWVVRAFLALFPFLALNYPIKKWAAAAALVIGLIYMLLADSGSATERSYIMIAVMFFAMLVDRPAVSLRNLAISALLILAFAPEESLGASFQMSFLAVMGLAAFFEWWNHRPIDVKLISASRTWRFSKYVTRLFLGSILTTLVAGGLSSIAAAYHFGRMAPFGTIANALSIPVVSLMVMPSALASALLMPFGFEYYPLKITEIGLWLTMKISDMVASWPGANLQIAKPDLVGVLLVVFGAILLSVMAGRTRILGVAVMAFGILFARTAERPLILIEERAANVAVLDSNGDYVFADSRKGEFAGDKWLASNGEQIKMADAAAKPGWTCLEGMCFSDLITKSIGYIHEPSSANWTCPPVEILIADFPLRKRCREIATRIDRFDVWKHGAHAIYLSGTNIRIETVKSSQGTRPWVYVPRARPKPKPVQPELPPTAFSG